MLAGLPRFLRDDSVVAVLESASAAFVAWVFRPLRGTPGSGLGVLAGVCASREAVAMRADGARYAVNKARWQRWRTAVMGEVKSGR